jgi:hypothetical protein
MGLRVLVKVSGQIPSLLVHTIHPVDDKFGSNSLSIQKWHCAAVVFYHVPHHQVYRLTRSFTQFPAQYYMLLIIYSHQQTV